jgi:hypothetical protein
MSERERRATERIIELESAVAALSRDIQAVERWEKYHRSAFEKAKARIDKALALCDQWAADGPDDADGEIVRIFGERVRAALSGPASPPVEYVEACECCATDEAQRYKRGQCTSREDGTPGCGHPYARHWQSPLSPVSKEPQTPEPEWTPKVGDKVTAIGSPLIGVVVWDWWDGTFDVLYPGGLLCLEGNAHHRPAPTAGEA